MLRFLSESRSAERQDGDATKSLNKIGEFFILAPTTMQSLTHVHLILFVHFEDDCSMSNALVGIH